MPLETASYINQLEATNPASTDAVATTDDHIRLIKTTLKATFPKIEGPVTATQAELNKVIANTSDIEALKTGKMDKAGGSFAGAVALDAGNLNVKTGKVQEAGNALLPTGIVTMWYGAVNAVPAGWALCNGQVVNGIQTPNLTDRFIVGAGANYSVGMTGGYSTQNVNTTQNGAHGHSTDSQGSHSHGGATAGHALTVDQMPRHGHGINNGTLLGVLGGSQHALGSPTPYLNGVAFQEQGSNQQHSHGLVVDGLHSHSISMDAGHIHAVSFDNKPPFFALCYIMKL